MTGEFISAGLVESANSAFAEVRSAEAAAALEREKLVQLEIEQQDGKAERERLRELEDRDAAIRALDGDSAAPKKASRVARLAALDSRIPALQAAIAIQSDRVEARERAIAGPKPPFTAAILDITTSAQGASVDTVREMLARLAHPLAELIAADQIRNSTIGERFELPVGSKAPFSGLVAVRKLLNAIPERFRPRELDEKRLLDAAYAISSKVITQIQGDKS